MIDELAKELGLGINEEHDNAVLYSVMLRFLKKKAKEYNMEMDSLFLQVTEEDGTIDLYEHSHDCENPPIFIDETKPNEA